MRVAVLSTFPPRACGIATFSADLCNALRRVDGVDRVDVIAVESGDLEYSSPVVATISQESRSDYVRAARLVGRLGADVVVIQHEFGIFGGHDGDYVLSFTGELAVPYVVTLHTVLGAPSASQATVLDELCRRAAAVLVFTETARRLVLTRDTADSEIVHVVPHGAPPEICAVASRTPSTIPIAGQAGVGPLDTSDRFVVSSFGLLSPGKGVEHVIDAIAKVAPAHPEVLLFVAGRTHPEIVRHDGERYRLHLQQRVRQLDLGDHVTFDDRFLTVNELAELLAASDLSVTAYTSAEQIVSGALTFAVAAGRPIVTTPYRYAEDLLTGGAGRFVPFNDSAALAEVIAELIERPDELERMHRASARLAAELSWPAVGQATAAILDRAAATTRPVRVPEAPLVTEPGLPPLRADHLRALIDDVGIIQHALGAVPNRATGYCVDDVARLLQVAFQLAQRTDELSWRIATQRALGFLCHAASGRGMHNLMSYDRRWIDPPHAGDHVGRAIWALGDLLAADLPPALADPATRLFERLVAALPTQPLALRTAAYAVLGLSRTNATVDGAVLRRLTRQLADAHQYQARDGWDWFEPTITYDNARIPQALIAAGTRLDDDSLRALGLRTLRWYGDECDVAGTLRLPGNGGRRFDEDHPGSGDEQPLDAAALVEAEICALDVTGDAVHGERALAAFEWFTGRNHLGASLYDPTTGGCCDGLGDDQVNANQGAESTLVYYTARLAIEAAGLPVIARRHARTAA